MFLGNNIINRKLVPYLEGLTYDCLFVLCDEEVFNLQKSRVEPLLSLLENEEHLLVIRAGEGCKTIEQMQVLWQWLKDKGASRQSLLLNIGGGDAYRLRGLCWSNLYAGH